MFYYCPSGRKIESFILYNKRMHRHDDKYNGTGLYNDGADDQSCVL